jgi:hypothetical protein
MGAGKDESTSFFAKKEAKTRLFTVGCGTAQAKSRRKQKFFASFFQKRSASFLFDVMGESSA